MESVLSGEQGEKELRKERGGGQRGRRLIGPVLSPVPRLCGPTRGRGEQGGERR